MRPSPVQERRVCVCVLFFDAPSFVGHVQLYMCENPNEAYSLCSSHGISGCHRRTKQSPTAADTPVLRNPSATLGQGPRHTLCRRFTCVKRLVFFCSLNNSNKSRREDVHLADACFDAGGQFMGSTLYIREPVGERVRDRSMLIAGAGWSRAFFICGLVDTCASVCVFV